MGLPRYIVNNLISGASCAQATTQYPAANLYDGRVGKPFLANNTTISITLTLTSGFNTDAICIARHNLTVSPVLTPSGGSPITLTLNTADDSFGAIFTPSAATSWTLVVTSNAVNVQIGEIFMGQSGTFGTYGAFDFGSSMGAEYLNDLHRDFYGSVAGAYELSNCRLISLNWGRHNDTTRALLRYIWRTLSGNYRPFAFVKDSADTDWGLYRVDNNYGAGFVDYGYFSTQLVLREETAGAPLS
jgi:hypothetical protein